MSDVTGIFCSLVYIDRAASGFDVQTLSPNLLTFCSFYCCIDICFPSSCV